MSNNELAESNPRVNSLVEKLRSRINNFAVIDRQGQVLGEVKDLILDNNCQLNFVVSQLATARSPRLFLLLSKLIEKIDDQNKSVLVNVNKAEIENFPEYVNIEKSKIELSENQNSPATPAYEVVDEGITKDREGIVDTSVGFAESPADNASLLQSFDTPEVSEEEIVRILEERLVVDRSKRKVGEVIVRKEIETRMVQVPVRCEKLIFEQVSPEGKQLADIELEQEAARGIELNETAMSATTLDSKLTVRGEFNSPKVSSLLLNALSRERRHGCKNVRVEIVVEDAERQKTYQEWFDRCSDSQTRQSE